MRKIFILTLVIMLVLCACEKKPAEIGKIQKTEETFETTALTEPQGSTDEACLKIDVENIYSLPCSRESACVSGSDIGGFAKTYVFDLGLVFYLEQFNTPAENDNEFYRCEISLPEGYTDGHIIASSGDASSMELFVTVLASKNGEEKALEYMFFADAPTNVVTCVELDEIPNTPLNELFRVVENPGNVNIKTIEIPLRTEETQIYSWEYNELYTIYVTYEILENNMNSFVSCTYDIFIVDKEKGEIAFEKALDVEHNPHRIAYTDDGCILSSFVLEDEEPRMEFVFEITEENGVFTVEPGEAAAYPYNEEILISPSGTYTAYRVVDDGWNNGGVDVKYPDGSIKRILTNMMIGDTPECKANGLAEVEGYSLVGFIDDTHLAYSIGGWEWLIGYGIYDLENGTKEEYRGQDPDSAVAVYDGHLIVCNSEYSEDDYSESGEAFKVALDGTKTKLFDTFYDYENGSSVSFVKGRCVHVNTENIDEMGRAQIFNITFFDAEGKNKLCEVEYAEVASNTYMHIYNDTITFVMPER